MSIHSLRNPRTKKPAFRRRCRRWGLPRGESVLRVPAALVLQLPQRSAYSSWACCPQRLTIGLMDDVVPVTLVGGSSVQPSHRCLSFTLAWLPEVRTSTEVTLCPGALST